MVMAEIIYNPGLAGTDYLNSKGRLSKIRKYHMTDEEMSSGKLLWEKEVRSVNIRTRKKAGDIFFNPYRQGIYYYQLQTLYLLGANEWHSLTDIVKKLEEYTSGIQLRASVIKTKGYHTAWDKFRGKGSREFARTSKDYIGRMQENFIMLQRLSQRHPYGYKLHQVCSAIDIKRINKRGFSQGVYFYRLSTYPTMEQALPLRDFSRFTFPKHAGKYVNRKFIGTIVTMDKVVSK
jgi:hypothetical protein